MSGGGADYVAYRQEVWREAWENVFRLMGVEAGEQETSEQKVWRLDPPVPVGLEHRRQMPLPDFLWEVDDFRREQEESFRRMWLNQVVTAEPRLTGQELDQVRSVLRGGPVGRYPRARPPRPGKVF